jgi:hypothetical protein
VVQPYQIHVVPPYEEAHVTHNVGCPDQMVLRGYTPCVIIRQHHVYNTKCRYNNYVNLGVTKKPKQVVKKDDITAVGIIKKRGVSVAVHEQHNHGCTQYRCNKGKHTHNKEEGNRQEGYQYAAVTQSRG